MASELLGPLTRPRLRVAPSPSSSALPRAARLAASRGAVAVAAGETLLVSALFFGAFALREPTLVASSLGLLVPAALGAGLLHLALAITQELYRPARLGMGWDQAVRLLRTWGVLALVAVLIVFLLKLDTPLRSRLALAGFLGAGFLLTGLLRFAVVRPMLRRRFGRALLGARVVVGTGGLALRLARFLEGNDSPLLVGFVDDRKPRENLSAPFLGGLDVPSELAAEGRITEVLVAREDLSRGDLVELAHGWTDRGLRVTVASSTFEVMVARASGEQVGGVPLAELRPSRQQGAARHLKRAFDVAAVGLGGLVLLPLLAAVALAVRFTSPGPILFRQERVGRGGRPFTMLKFRSMVTGNDDRRHREYVAGLMRGDEGGDGVFKLVDDPRITKVGAFLRRTSIDELPQLWNVLRGDMSLVGPRPCLPYEWEMYRDWQRRRLDAAPGLTGLWQVAGRSRVPFEDMVLLDLHYIANWSFRGDLALLARTIPVVVAGSGGH